MNEVIKKIIQLTDEDTIIWELAERPYLSGSVDSIRNSCLNGQITYREAKGLIEQAEKNSTAVYKSNYIGYELIFVWSGDLNLNYLKLVDKKIPSSDIELWDELTMAIKENSAKCRGYEQFVKEFENETRNYLY